MTLGIQCFIPGHDSPILEEDCVRHRPPVQLQASAMKPCDQVPLYLPAPKVYGLISLVMIWTSAAPVERLLMTSFLSSSRLFVASAWTPPLPLGVGAIYWDFFSKKMRGRTLGMFLLLALLGIKLSIWRPRLRCEKTDQTRALENSPEENICYFTTNPPRGTTRPKLQQLQAEVLAPTKATRYLDDCDYFKELSEFSLVAGAKYGAWNFWRSRWSNQNFSVRRWKKYSTIIRVWTLKYLRIHNFKSRSHACVIIEHHLDVKWWLPLRRARFATLMTSALVMVMPWKNESTQSAHRKEDEGSTNTPESLTESHDGSKDWILGVFWG